MPRLAFLVAMCLVVLASAVSAQEREKPSLDRQIYLAKVAYDAAVLDLHSYRFVEHPREVRALEHCIRMRRAEIAAIERQIEEWESMNRWRNGQILPLSVERAGLAIDQLQHELAEIEADLFYLHRQRAETIRLLTAHIDHWGNHLRALEALASGGR